MERLTCDTAGPLIARAADDALTAAQRERLQVHLAACGACRRALEAQIAVRGALRSRPPAPLPAGFDARLWSRLEAPAGWTPVTDWRQWTYRLAPIAAALAVAAFLAGARTDIDGFPDLAQVAESWAIGPEPDGTPVSAALWQPQVSGESLVALVLTAPPDGMLEDYLGRSDDEW